MIRQLGKYPDKTGSITNYFNDTMDFSLHILENPMQKYVLHAQERLFPRFASFTNIEVSTFIQTSFKLGNISGATTC